MIAGQHGHRRPPFPHAVAAAQRRGRAGRATCASLPLALGLAGVAALSGYPARELAQRAAIAWGAALLAFSGAVHWGLALGGRLPWRRGRARPGALAPLLGRGLAVLVGGQRGLALLVVGFGGLWLYEHRVLGAALPPAYLALRRTLTIATCVLLALTMFVSDAAGLT